MKRTLFVTVLVFATITLAVGGWIVGGARSILDLSE
jgi:hypothetical protein